MTTAEKSIYFCEKSLLGKGAIGHFHVLQPSSYTSSELKDIFLNIRRLLTNLNQSKSDFVKHNNKIALKTYLDSGQFKNVAMFFLTYDIFDHGDPRYLHMKFYTKGLETSKKHDEMLNPEEYIVYSNSDVELFNELAHTAREDEFNSYTNIGLVDEIINSIDTEQFEKYIYDLSNAYVKIINDDALPYKPCNATHKNVNNFLETNIHANRLFAKVPKDYRHIKYAIKMNIDETYDEFKLRLYEEIIRLLSIYSDSEKFPSAPEMGKTGDEVKLEFIDTILEDINGAKEKGIIVPCAGAVDPTSLVGGYNANIKRLEAKYKKYKSKYLNLKRSIRS